MLAPRLKASDTRENTLIKRSQVFRRSGGFRPLSSLRVRFDLEFCLGPHFFSISSKYTRSVAFATNGRFHLRSFLQRSATFMALPGTVVIAYALFVSLFFCGQSVAAQDAAPPAPLSIDEIVRLHSAGFSDDVLITRIRKYGKAFRLSTDELLDLRKAGLSDTVMRFLLDPSQPYTPPPPVAKPDNTPPPATPKNTRQYPPDENAAQVPLEPGLYRFIEGKPVRIELKLLLAQISGGALGKVGKAKGVAYLVGVAAGMRVKEPAPVFYLKAAEGKSAEDIVLVQLELKSERREIEIGPKPAKPELKADAIRPFEAVEVGPQLFRLTASKLAGGEYLFFVVGTADPAKGSAGKGFDFGIDGAGPEETKGKKGKKEKKK